MTLLFALLLVSSVSSTIAEAPLQGYDYPKPPKTLESPGPTKVQLLQSVSSGSASTETTSSKFDTNYVQDFKLPSEDPPRPFVILEEQRPLNIPKNPSPTDFGHPISQPIKIPDRKPSKLPNKKPLFDTSTQEYGLPKQPSQAYNPPPPVYENQKPFTLYGLPPPVNEPPKKPFETYGPPPTVNVPLQRPTTSYGPPPQIVPPKPSIPTFSPPPTVYVPPKQPTVSYGPPPQNVPVKPSAPSFSPPPSVYVPTKQPTISFSQVSQGYVPPKQPSQSYGPPSQGYVPPKQPSQSYGPPSSKPITSYGPPPQGIPSLGPLGTQYGTPSALLSFSGSYPVNQFSSGSTYESFPSGNTGLFSQGLNSYSNEFNTLSLPAFNGASQVLPSFPNTISNADTISLSLIEIGPDGSAQYKNDFSELNGLLGNVNLNSANFGDGQNNFGGVYQLGDSFSSGFGNVRGLENINTNYDVLGGNFGSASEIKYTPYIHRPFGISKKPC